MEDEEQTELRYHLASFYKLLPLERGSLTSSLKQRTESDQYCTVVNTESIRIS